MRSKYYLYLWFVQQDTVHKLFVYFFAYNALLHCQHHDGVGKINNLSVYIFHSSQNNFPWRRNHHHNNKPKTTLLNMSPTFFLGDDSSDASDEAPQAPQTINMQKKKSAT